MHARTLLLLFLVVAALGGVAWWQMQREQGGEFDTDRALLSGFDRGRVTALRVDNLERSLQLRIEARPDGSFQIVDPVDFPAEPAVLEVLFDLLANQRAIRVPPSDLKKLSLDPPRVVLEIEEGARAPRRIEIGAIDVDLQHVFARVDGELVRTERGLDSTLERDLSDWRARRILGFSPSTVVELHRRGSTLPPEAAQPIDLALDATLDGPWRATAPFSAQLQPNGVALLIATLAAVQAESFIDAPGGLEHYGLDRPAIEFEVVDVHGARESLHLAPEPGREMWFAMRAGSPHVFRVSNDTVSALGVPSEALIERRLFDFVRSDVKKIELSADGRSTTLARTGRGWTLSARDGERTTIDSEPADGARVEDLLSALERAKFSGLLFERRLAESDAIGSLRVHLANDVQGGILGAPFTTGDGAQGVPYRRDGDALVAALQLEWLELARTDPISLRSLELHKVVELQVARIELDRGATKRIYVRNAEGRWSRGGTELEAREFAKLVDRLLALRAVEVLQRGFDDRLDDPIVVRIVTGSGAEVAFTLARLIDPSGAPPRVVYRNDSRQAAIKPELYDDLRALLTAE